jgi:hypothetical protein
MNNYPGNNESNQEIEDVSQFSNEKLCSLVAANRYLKLNEAMQLECMKELAKRRDGGDNFNFEEKIKEYFDQLPPIDLNLPNVMSMLNDFTKKYKL